MVNLLEALRKKHLQKHLFLDYYLNIIVPIIYFTYDAIDRNFDQTDSHL